MKIFFTSIEFIRVATEGFMESLGMRLDENSCSESAESYNNGS